MTEVPANSLRRAGRGSVLNLAGAAISAVATFGLTVLVTRMVSHVDAGIFFGATSLFVLANAVCQLGTDTGLVYFVSRARTLGHTNLLSAYFHAALRPVMFLSVVMAGAAFWWAPEIAQLTTASHVEAMTHALRALAPLVPLAALEAVCLTGTRGLGTMRPYTLIEQVVRPLAQLIVAAAILIASIPVQLSWSWSLPYLVAGLWAWQWWRRLSRPSGLRQFPPASDAYPEPSEHDPGEAHDKPLAPGTGIYAEFWRFTAPRSLASMAQIAMQRLDIVLVAAISGPVAAATYTAATRFVVLGQFARNAVSLAVQPHLASALTKKDHHQADRIFGTSTAWLMAVTWPLFFALIVGGEQLLGVFGRGYDAGAAVLVFLSLSMLVNTVCGDVDVLLIMAGRPTWSLANTAVAFVLQFGLDLALIPDHGVLGAAIAWSVAIVAKSLIALVQVWLLLRMHPFSAATLMVGAVSAVCYGAVPALFRWWSVGPVDGLALGILLGTAMYVVALSLARGLLGLDEVFSQRTAGTASRRWPGSRRPRRRRGRHRAPQPPPQQRR